MEEEQRAAGEHADEAQPVAVGGAGGGPGEASGREGGPAVMIQEVAAASGVASAEPAASVQVDPGVGPAAAAGPGGSG